MKTLNFILSLLKVFFLIPFISVFGQEFQLDTGYSIIEPDYRMDSLYWLTPPGDREPISIFLTLSGDSLNYFQELTLIEAETYEGYKIYSLKNTQLKNVKEIVHVQLEYFACCSSIENHYYLVTDKDEWVKLPILDYIACDGPEAFKEYRFPSQEFGIQDQIIETLSFPDSAYLVDSVAVLRELKWNGSGVVVE